MSEGTIRLTWIGYQGPVWTAYLQNGNYVLRVGRDISRPRSTPFFFKVFRYGDDDHDDGVVKDSDWFPTPEIAMMAAEQAYFEEYEYADSQD